MNDDQSYILLIDDDPILRLTITRALESFGYRVIAVNNGAAGILQAMKSRPAMILCDWMMSPLDGIGVCRQIKSQPDLALTFFILITSRTDVTDRVRGFEAGADDFLTKPIDLIELRARVRSAWQFHSLNQDLVAQKQLLEDEFAEAGAYVRSILPQPMTAPLKIDTCFIPSIRLGGDCFDYYWLDPDFLVIYLLDVSGHGLSATLPSITVHNTLRSQMLPGVNFYRPDRVLQGLNETFQISDDSPKYFTIWYGVYDRRKRLLMYASAGHPPGLLVSPPTADQPAVVHQLSSGGLPIGMMPDVKFDLKWCTVPAGSHFYVFSDGLYEIQNLPPEMTWDLQILEQELTQHLDDSAEMFVDRVRSQCQQTSFADDLALIRVRF